MGRLPQTWRVLVAEGLLDGRQVVRHADPKRLADSLQDAGVASACGQQHLRIEQAAPRAGRGRMGGHQPIDRHPHFGNKGSGAIDLYYEDQGWGKPVVLIHGWPLSGRSWEKQVDPLLDAGHRVITYDRRGFGDSSRQASGYDYDVLADDLHKLMTKLDLHGATLVGFSMGTGEVARYLGTHGSRRVEKAVFISSVPPFVLQTPHSSGAVDAGAVDGIKKGIAADRLAALSTFLALGGSDVTEQIVQFSWNVASGTFAKGTMDCVQAWLTDFRNDLPRIDVPALVIHGNADRILPIDVTGIPLSEAVEGSRLVVIDGGPHGLIWTHAEEVNRELLAFLDQQESCG